MFLRDFAQLFDSCFYWNELNRDLKQKTKTKNGTKKNIYWIMQFFETKLKTYF